MGRIRYWITGGWGQLARELWRRLPDSVARSREDLSIADPGLVHREIFRSSPEVVFNCAAYNAVDRAELEPEQAAAVNVRGAANLARTCREVGARLVHFSTNYVFDGTARQPYSEADEPRPLNVYGRSKREGEIP